MGTILRGRVEKDVDSSLLKFRIVEKLSSYNVTEITSVSDQQGRET